MRPKTLLMETSGDPSRTTNSTLATRVKTSEVSLKWQIRTTSKSATIMLTKPNKNSSKQARSKPTYNYPISNATSNDRRIIQIWSAKVQSSCKGKIAKRAYLTET